MTSLRGKSLARLREAADWVAVLLAATLPVSTSATSVVAAVWLVCLLPTVNSSQFKQTVFTPAGGLPIALVLLAVAGLSWADVSWPDRWHGLDSFVKMLAIPFLLVQFADSDRAQWPLVAYVGACTLVLALSSLLAIFPALHAAASDPVPFKNAATQSGEFVSCIFVLLFLAKDHIARGKTASAAGLIFLAAAFLRDIAYSSTGRTALVVALILSMIFAFRYFEAKVAWLVCLLWIAVCGAIWMSSSYLQTRTLDIYNDLVSYRKSEVITSSGERLEFWQKSLSIMQTSPVFGHGTGSILEQMQRQTETRAGPSAAPTPNPHQQSLAVGIQLGLLGVALLWMMWGSHLLLFRGAGLTVWIGSLVVIQNIVGSLFNSHLFDFTQGWTYVVGVGVAGGAILRERALESSISRA